MNEGFDLQNYLIEGVEGVVKEAIKATIKNPRESAFMLKFAAASRAASKKRRKAEDNGEHIPPFLIASITSSCNLHCAGCYSRCNHATVDSEPVKQLSGEEWLRIFGEADDTSTHRVDERHEYVLQYRARHGIVAILIYVRL